MSSFIFHSGMGIPNSVLESLCHFLPVFAYDSPYSSLSELNKFRAPIYLFRSFHSEELLSLFRLFMDDVLFSLDFDDCCSKFY